MSLKLPTASDSKKWESIAEALIETLEGVSLRSGSNKIKSLPINDLVELYEKTVYAVLREKCDLLVPVTRTNPHRSRSDRGGKLEKKLKIKKKALSTKYKAAERGDTVMSEEELKKCSRQFHVLL